MLRSQYQQVNRRVRQHRHQRVLPTTIQPVPQRVNRSRRHNLAQPVFLIVSQQVHRQAILRVLRSQLQLVNRFGHLSLIRLVTRLLFPRASQWQAAVIRANLNRPALQLVNLLRLQPVNPSMPLNLIRTVSLSVVLNLRLQAHHGLIRLRHLMRNQRALPLRHQEVNPNATLVLNR